MRKIVKWIASFFVLLSAVSAFAKDRPHFDCTPSFPFQQEWVGADAAYSIPMSDGRDVWIFGDTLYGDERQVTGDVPQMVHNTIGISTCKNGEWKIHYTIRRDAKGDRDSFFKPQQNNGSVLLGARRCGA